MGIQNLPTCHFVGPLTSGSIAPVLVLASLFIYQITSGGFLMVESDAAA